VAKDDAILQHAHAAHSGAVLFVCWGTVRRCAAEWREQFTWPQGGGDDVSCCCAAQDSVDVEQVKAVFPYGSVHVEVVEGGLRASSGIAIAELGAWRQQALDMRLKLLTWSCCCLQRLVWRQFE
jgi:Conserved hypothetical protein (Lin0512_fam)